MRYSFRLLLCFVGLIPSAVLASTPLVVLQNPTLSATHIAFAHAGQIWTVPREGGRASRLVTGQSANDYPVLAGRSLYCLRRHIQRQHRCLRR